MSLPEAMLLDLRLQDVGGPVTSGRLYGWHIGQPAQDWDARLGEFSRAVAGRVLLLLIHGYNVDRPGGIASCTQYAQDLQRLGVDAVPLVVLWPGDGWAKALTYPSEARDADDSAQALARWLRINAAAARVSLVAHSLGSRVALQTALRLLRTADGPQLDRVCLMAPAVDNDACGRAGNPTFAEVTLGVRQLAVLASQQDRVLQWAYPLGDLAQMFLGGGRWNQALGRTGAEERDSDVLAKLQQRMAQRERDIDHGDYLGRAETGTGTASRSEEFVSAFLRGDSAAPWPAAQPTGSTVASQ